MIVYTILIPAEEALYETCKSNYGVVLVKKLGIASWQDSSRHGMY